MDKKPFTLDMMVFILNYGYARKMIKCARKAGFRGATIFPGKGTGAHTKKWVERLDLTDARKEVVLMLSDAHTMDEAMPQLLEKFKLHKPNHGIAFRMPVLEIIGSMHFADNQKSNEVSDSMYHAIFVIVDKGSAEDVIEAATKAGSKGGTIINARGAGIHETSKVFNMEIEPEKEVVLILSEAKQSDKIIASIREEMNIDEPGKGFIFVQHVKETYGMLK